MKAICLLLFVQGLLEPSHSQSPIVTTSTTNYIPADDDSVTSLDDTSWSSTTEETFSDLNTPSPVSETSAPVKSSEIVITPSPRNPTPAPSTQGSGGVITPTPSPLGSDAAMTMPPGGVLTPTPSPLGSDMASTMPSGGVSTPAPSPLERGTDTTMSPDAVTTPSPTVHVPASEDAGETTTPASIDHQPTSSPTHAPTASPESWVDTLAPTTSGGRRAMDTTVWTFGSMMATGVLAAGVAGRYGQRF